ncbi:hemolysin family protein [Lichenihabitans psoromatis]|uniref:hemolysin family protein n=1 Tax=Lichenihabitans psoromatis TaxID=2528642 RepID=UPI001035940F|nr:hemolysin family protein [Lichenihabitans psoromatis]
MSAHEREPGERGDKRSPAPSMIERLRSLFGLSHASIRDDIEEALDDTDEAGVFSQQERSMLRNVLGLHELRVADVMVPRADIIAVSLTMTLGEVLTVFRTAGHSRLPVHGDTLDDARGMVHIRDFVQYVAVPAGLDVPSFVDLGEASMGRTLEEADILRPVLFVPPSMQALDLLVRMQAFRTHMALVIDEYGGTDGLVSIEDIVEMIVGDIEDEHDESESPKIVLALDGSHVADARAGLDEVSEAIGVDFSEDADAEEVDTLGGLISALAGHVPGRGEIVQARDGVEFEILDADPRRVKRVRIVRTMAVVGSTPPATGAPHETASDEAK